MGTQIKVLMLDASDVDSDGVAALVGMIREFRNAPPEHAVPAKARVGSLLASGTTALEPPKELPRPSAPAAEPKPALSVGKNGRVTGAGDAIVAALRKSPTPDRAKLAQTIYGDARKAHKVSQLLSYLCSTGKLKNNGDGSYKVVG